MSAPPDIVGQGWRLAARPPARTVEFTAFGFPLGGAFVVGWPAAPGAVRHDSDGRPVLLHFAPARWLVPAPHADIQAVVDAAVQAEAGVIVDVDGKWVELELTGPAATRVLAATLDVDATLEGRECAAVTLFECPAILARGAQGFAIWLQRSYEGHFRLLLGGLRDIR
jgi:heterotetrameric sarcosine oxidase gamma subunit